MNQKLYPALSQLLGCYLHQDWREEFESDADAFEAMKTSEPRNQIDAGIWELDSLITKVLSEEALRLILTETIGCFFDPSSDGMTYASWLLKSKLILSEGSGTADLAVKHPN